MFGSDGQAKPGLPHFADAVQPTTVTPTKIRYTDRSL